MRVGIRPCHVCEGSGTIDPEKYTEAIKRWLCIDCGNHAGHFYRVRNSVWRSAGMSSGSRSGFLCIPCLAKRVYKNTGRALCIEDFPLTAPVNQALHMGYRLGLADGRKRAAKEIEPQCPECAEALDPEES